MPSGETTPARRRLHVACAAAVCSATLLAGAACGDRTSYRPSSIGGGEPPTATSPADDSETPRPTAAPTPRTPSPATEKPADKPADKSIDVCALMPAKRLSALLHRSKVPTAQSAPSAGGGGAVPGMGRVSQCTYAYAKGQSANRVKVSVMPATGQKDADTFVRAVLGRGSKTITGAGDSAGVKVGMGGYGMKLLAAARRIDQEIAGVTILMPEKIPANRYRAVVNEVFGHVA